ncbi:unnamed protein product [Pipistrellus nathusii]|uniref:Apolipoprotein L3 n=1 Tax=Pipistrellus nathusii TaxID=59473 RepID=A0ABP0A4Q7_PIPNA
MASETDRNCPEHKDFIDAIEFLKDPWNKENLQRLLSDESWKRFVAAASLSRDEADALYADLSQLETFMAMEDKVNRERFMKEFPQAKQDLEERIRKLYALADEVDKLHRGCTITQVVASSTGALAGVLSIAGLCLAPFTAGASLSLPMSVVGLGAAAAVTGVATKIIEGSNDGSAKAKASRLMSTGTETEKEVEEILRHSPPQIASIARRCFKSLQRILRKADVLNAEESNSIKLAAVPYINGRGAVIGQIGHHMINSFGRTARFLGKGAKFLGPGAGLLVDVVDLVNESKHLSEGAKAQLAEDLRQQAQELKRRLEKLIRTYESLQEDLTP